MERDYDYTSAPHAADLDAPDKHRPQRRRTRGGARQSAQGRDLQGAGGVRSAGLGLAGRPSDQRRQRRLDRAQDELPERTGSASKLFDKPIRIIDDPLRRARLALAAVRRRRRRGQAARDHRRRRADHLAARLRHRARARPGQRPAMPIAAYRRRRRRGRTICISKPGELSPDELIADIKDGFYVTDLIGSGVNGSPATTAAAPPGFWIENGETQLCGERGDHRRPSARDLQAPERRPTICSSATAPTRRRSGSKD